MKIRQVHIERFGAWNDVSVTLAPNGLTVLYGPNETGKSTMVRFLRSVLYGYLPQDELTGGARPRAAGCAGELIVEDGRDELIVRRASAVGGQAELRRRSPLGSDSTPTLPALLGGISRELYERVFAVGLSELQELATLQGDETSQFIYQLSLGDEGEQLIALLRQSQSAHEALVGTRQRDGELQHWQRVINEIDSQLAEAATADARHADLEREHAEIAARIDEQQWRQRGLNEQLRGHAFLERVWVPWQRHRRLQHELDGLPDVAGFPEDGAQRLSQLESGIAGLRRDDERLNQTRRRLRTEFQRSAGDRSLRPHAPEIRHLLQSFDSLRGLEASLPALKSAAETARRQLDEQLRQLGPGWSESRLEKIDPAPAAAVKLFRQADRYRAAARGRARCMRAYRRMATLLQQRQSEQATVLRPYAGAGVRDAQQRVRQELADLDDLRRLESQQQAKVRLLTELRAESAAASKQEGLPSNFMVALGVLGAAGLVLSVAGIWKFYAGGGIQAAIVGMIFVLLSICCGGLIWTIKQRLESESGDPSRWRRREEEVQAELTRVERDMQRLVQQPEFLPIEDDDGGLRIAGRDGIGDLSDPDEISERFETLIDQLTELGSAGQREADLQDRRNRLSNMRERIRLLQRAVSQSRRDWCVVLKEAGLDESVRVAGALEVWQAAQEARRQQLALREAQAAVQSAEAAWRDFTTRVAALARQIDPENAAARPLDVLNRWRGRLDMLAAADSRRAALRQELREAQRTLRATRQQHRQQVTARRNLLSSVGARTRQEFLQIDSARRRRQELDAETSLAEDELAEAAASEPELAIVEDDLLRFDGAANREAIATIESELSDLQGDLRTDHEQLGRVEQELAAHEADRRAVSLRYERAQADSELQRVIRQLSAVELASRGLEALRAQLESERQPQTLNVAGTYLQQLTAGKYQRVWAPLGEKSLVIDDDRSHSFRVDQLSSGTREQLFLSIRLALIDEFLRQGIELPIVLDDLFVNFDQQRTEAAVRTVINYAADGRQLLLLTCHQHLVKLFEAAGVTTVRLPEQESLHDRRRVG